MISTRDRIGLLLVLSCFAHDLSAQSKSSLRAASKTYRGVTLGITTRQEVLRLFGKPSTEYKMPLEKDRVEFRYLAPAGEPSLTLYLKNNVVDELEEYPASLTPEKAIEKFGPDFQRHRYSFDDCLSDGEGAPLFRDPKGQFEFIEYRHRNLYLQLRQYRNLVESIVLSSIPPGSLRSQCPVAR
jgi:hypothetical protein